MIFLLNIFVFVLDNTNRHGGFTSSVLLGPRLDRESLAGLKFWPQWSCQILKDLDNLPSALFYKQVIHGHMPVKSHFCVVNITNVLSHKEMSVITDNWLAVRL
jgi:hypothetical protein